MTGRRSVIDPDSDSPWTEEGNRKPLTGFGTHLVRCTSDLVPCMSHLEDFAHAPCRRPRACCGGSSTSWRFLCGSRAGLLVPLRQRAHPCLATWSASPQTLIRSAQLVEVMSSVCDPLTGSSWIFARSEAKKKYEGVASEGRRSGAPECPTVAVVS